MRRAAAVALVLAAGAAQAHPGHFAGEVLHFLSAPDHLAILLLPLAIGAAIWTRRGLQRAIGRRRGED